jgi:hypothetical protein
MVGMIRLLGLLLWDTAGPSALLCAVGLCGIFVVLGAMRAVWWLQDRRKPKAVDPMLTVSDEEFDAFLKSLP